MATQIATTAPDRRHAAGTLQGALVRLRTRRACARLAGRYERIVAEAEREDRGITARIPVQRAA